MGEKFFGKKRERNRKFVVFLRIKHIAAPLRVIHRESARWQERAGWSMACHPAAFRLASPMHQSNRTLYSIVRKRAGVARVCTIRPSAHPSTIPTKPKTPSAQKKGEKKIYSALTITALSSPLCTTDGLDLLPLDADHLQSQASGECDDGERDAGVERLRDGLVVRLDDRR